MKKASVLIIFGGKSEEYDVSLRSVSTVLSNINYDRYNVFLIGITRDGKWLLAENDLGNIANDTWQKNAIPVKIDFSTGCVDNLPKIDVAFPVVHGSFCEDGRLQAIFEALNLNYVGCDSYSSFICMNKSLTKQLATCLSIPVVNGFEVSKNQLESFYSVLKQASKLGYPVFVKPVCSGSSRGASLVSNPNGLFLAVSEALKYSSTALIEEFIESTECEIGILQHPDGKAELSCVGALAYNNNFYDYNTKYVSHGTTYQIPANLPLEISKKIENYAHTLFNFLGLRGLARIDFFVTGEHKIYLNEINTLPGFTEISMYPMLFKQGGYTIEALIDALIDSASVKFQNNY